MALPTTTIGSTLSSSNLWKDGIPAHNGEVADSSTLWIRAPATGCDAESYIATTGCDGANCLLDNGRWSGECCTTEFQCLEGEGDCDSDDDCAGLLVCGTDNCGTDSPFKDNWDCCYDTESDEDGNGHEALVNAREQSDPLTVESESGSNDDPAGNGLADLSTTSLIGAVIGIVAVLAIAVGIVSVVRRRKRAGTEAETQTAIELGMDKAAVDSAESVTAETVAAVTVHVDKVPTDCAEMDTVEVTAGKATDDGVAAEEATTTADAGNMESV